MKIIRLSILLSLLVFAAGCGVYSFSGHGIGGIESIAIEPFDNQTAEFGVREQLTDIIISHMVNDRTLSVSSRSSADATLYGNILSISEAPLTYKEDETVTEYEIKITVSFVLRKPDQSEPVWEGKLVGSGSFPYSTGSIEERNEGIEKAMERLAEDLITKLTSDW